jgi:hypothetical protein
LQLVFRYRLLGIVAAGTAEPHELQQLFWPEVRLFSGDRRQVFVIDCIHRTDGDTMAAADAGIWILETRLSGLHREGTGKTVPDAFSATDTGRTKLDHD